MTSLWTAFLANFIFWTGMSAGAVAFAALLDLTSAEWAGPLRPTAGRFHRFLPVAVVLYLVLLIGAPKLYPWIEHPTGSAWLRIRPFIARDLTALVGIAAAGWSCARRRHAHSGRGGAGSTRVAPVVFFLIVYVIGFSVLAVDLVMSLVAPWTSTLFPAYLFTANVYAAIAAVAVASSWSARS